MTTATAVTGEAPATLAADTEALLDTAWARHRAADPAGALAGYRKILTLDPAHAEGLHGVGIVALQAGRPAVCCTWIERALQALPAGSARMWYHLGVASARLGRVASAADALLAAVRADPAYDGAYQLLADLLSGQGRNIDAAATLLALARSRFRRGLTDQAVAAYHAALERDPAHIPALLGVAPLLRFFGRTGEAAAAYRAVLDREPENLGARLGLCAARLPILHETPQGVQDCRAAFARELAALHRLTAQASTEERAKAEFAVGDCKPFYLNYHGLNDRDLLRLYGDVVGQIMGAYLPAFSTPLAVRPLTGGRPLRIGFASTYLYEHSVTKLFTGWATELDRRHFEVLVYHLGGGSDAYTDRLRSRAVRFVEGAGNTIDWAETIRDDRLDALIYFDVGMSGMEVRLASLRLAPLQCLTWGHPVTTGFATMDAFLSSALMEPFNGADHYTEELVALPNLSVYYDPVRHPDEPIDRHRLGLEAGDIVFACCQSLFKYLPQYDGVYPAIAARLPAARFVFIRHHLPEVSALFERRLDAAFRAAGLNAADHCRFTPHLPRASFGPFLDLADVYLDSIGWSGGNTTLEAAGRHRPIVTLAGDLMRGRHSTGILRRLGLDPFVTHSLADYVERAVALGSDAALRRRVEAHLADRAPLLYRDAAPVRALESWLRNAVAARA